MDLYEITDDYIKYLQQFDKRVLSNHFVKHNRKYLGLGIELSGHMYYIPLSSPDSMDFDSNGNPRRTIIPIYRIYGNNGRLLGKLLLNNMIPVPMSELTKYDITKEQDFKYKKLILSEIRALSKNGVIDRIIKNAQLLYKQKQSGMNIGYLAATVDFANLEKEKIKYNTKILRDKGR